MDFAKKKSDGKARQNLFNWGKKGFVNKSGERGGGGGMSRDTRPNSEQRTARVETVPGESREEPGARPWKCSRSLRQEPQRDSPRETAGSSERETDIQGQLIWHLTVTAEDVGAGGWRRSDEVGLW